MSDGDPVQRVCCPGCNGQQSVVYNGNYFCTDEDCGWVMGEDETPYDRYIVRQYLQQRRRLSTDPEERNRMTFYLLRLGADS